MDTYELGYIKCGDIAELVIVCAALVREGITFKACTVRLRVRLTGGY